MLLIPLSEEQADVSSGRCFFSIASDSSIGKEYLQRRRFLRPLPGGIPVFVSYLLEPASSMLVLFRG